MDIFGLHIPRRRRSRSSRSRPLCDRKREKDALILVPSDMVYMPSSMAGQLPFSPSYQQSAFDHYWYMRQLCPADAPPGISSGTRHAPPSSSVTLHIVDHRDMMNPPLRTVLTCDTRNLNQIRGWLAQSNQHVTCSVSGRQEVVSDNTPWSTLLPYRGAITVNIHPAVAGNGNGGLNEDSDRSQGHNRNRDGGGNGNRDGDGTHRETFGRSRA